jgi:hypothetical protein
MSEGTARVESTDALRIFRAALVKFAEAADLALGDAESELHRTLMWLETEQDTFWQHQVRKWTEQVAIAKDRVRQKKLFKDSTGRMLSAIDEEKALAIAVRRLEEAQEKLTNTRRWARKLPKELHNYKGGVQRLATTVAVAIPAAVARLDKLGGLLEAYVSLAAGTPRADASAPPPRETADAATGLPSMARGEAAPEDGGEGAPADLSRLPGFPQVGPAQVVLVRLAAQPSPDGRIAVADEDAFRVFDSAELAGDYARQHPLAQAEGRWAVCDAAGRPVHAWGVPTAAGGGLDEPRA